MLKNPFYNPKRCSNNVQSMEGQSKLVQLKTAVVRSAGLVTYYQYFSGDKPSNAQQSSKV